MKANSAALSIAILTAATIALESPSVAKQAGDGHFTGGDRIAWKKSCDLIDAGRVWMRDGKIHNAIRCYKEAVRIYPTSYLGFYQLGNTSKTLGDMKDAEVYFKKSIAIEPKFPDAHVALSDVYISLKRYKEAEISIRKALELKPNNFDYSWTLGDILCRSGKYKESFEIYKKVSIRPEARQVKGEFDAWHEELIERLR